VDRYLQKGYSEYKGFAQVKKVYEIVHMPPKVKMDDSEADTAPRVEIKKELVSKHIVRIPKVSRIILCSCAYKTLSLIA
jgi:hypothetical protein